MNICYNGEIIKEEDFNVSLFNRAFNYGDGLFETIVFKENEIFFLEDHINRLLKGMCILGMNIPTFFNLLYFETKMRLLINQNINNSKIRFKILVYRKDGGLYLPSNNDIDFVISYKDIEQAKNILNKNIGIANSVTLNYSTLSSLKTTNALPYIVASNERNNRNLDDLIILDNNDNIAELISSNIFFLTNDNVLCTPTIKTGCIDGILRRNIIKTAEIIGQEIKIDFFSLEDLLTSKYVFGTNAIGINCIKKINETYFSTVMPERIHKILTLLRTI